LEMLHKSLEEGNLDPREIEKAKVGQKADYPVGIPECGTDATRFALCAYTSQGRDINLDVSRVAAYRNFCNKLWNATKFALMNLGPDFKPAATQPKCGESIWETWILSRLANQIKLANDGFKTYDFSQATSAVYNFWLYELCDVYLESMKPTMQNSSEDPAIIKKQGSLRETLYTCLDNGLRLLQPFMPFVTEELYQRLPRRPSESYESVCIAPFPQEVPAWINDQVERDVKFTQEIVRSIRSLRASFNLTKEKPKVFINLKSEDLQKALTPLKEVARFLSQSSDMEIIVDGTNAPEGCAVEIVNENCQVYMLIKGLVDIAAEIKRLEKKRTGTQGEYDRMLKQMNGQGYHKLPDKLKEENSKRVDAFLQEIDIATKSIESYTKFL